MNSSIFVSCHWLAEHLNDDQVQILDSRLIPPGQEQWRDLQAEYLNGHLPQAPLFDIEKLSEPHSPYPHMLPSAEAFAVAMRELGIASDKHLVVYDEGDLFSAPRARWMLKHFGVEHVSILAGGLQAWQQAALPVESGAVTLPESEFILDPQPEAVVRTIEVLLASYEGTAQIVDARPAPRFSGEVEEPRPGLHRGHIPGSLNLPWNSLVHQGQLLSNAELNARFSAVNIDLSQPIIVSCGSGVTAAVVLTALEQLGVETAQLYDGSWSEWGSSNDLPIATSS